jgi:hypothetical protein
LFVSEIVYTNDGWPKLLRDVQDFPAETRRELGNGYMLIPSGTRGVIRHGSRWTNLTFQADKCECCGVQMRMHGCEKKDFMPV